ncbi:ABC transporter ATP-binding protein [Oscillospiraceae bacterium MB08-C2-2]|nr:ABC transporter ATP-binding protein [Oscillospiraceae bacterium MB08-C2-2]
MLKLSNVSAGYGDLQVLFDVSLDVGAGECVALVGSNGAGKTSLLRIVSGFLPITGGSVTFEGTDLMKTPTTERASMGIAHIPQGRGVLGTLNVMDNLILGGYDKRVKARRMDNIEKVFQIFPKLKQRQHQIAGSLSGGEQQMLAIGRALIMEPKLLMLDEPSLGLAPIIVEEVFETIGKVRDTGMSILIIEQNLLAALSIAQRGYALETGRIVLEDTAENLMNNEDIKKAYLGI